MPVLLLILYWCYFSCLKIYSENFFNAFISKCFLKSLWQRERQVSFFWEIIAWTVKFSLPNLRIFSLNFLYWSIPQSIFVISSFSWFMKLTFIHVGSSFHVILYLTWNWFQFIIFFYLIIVNLWVTIYTFQIT